MQVLRSVTLPRSLAHEVVQDEAPELDVDELLALEEEIVLELQRDRELEMRELLELQEMERYLEHQEAEDAQLFEQHMLGGVQCPLCQRGRLLKSLGELQCCACEMRASIMDEAITLEEVSEMLGDAECRHRSAGCEQRPRFEVENVGQPLLFLRCSCGWSEVVL